MSILFLTEKQCCHTWDPCLSWPTQDLLLLFQAGGDELFLPLQNRLTLLRRERKGWYQKNV